MSDRIETVIHLAELLAREARRLHAGRRRLVIWIPHGDGEPLCTSMVMHHRPQALAVYRSLASEFAAERLRGTRLPWSHLTRARGTASCPMPGPKRLIRREFTAKFGLPKLPPRASTNGAR
jgi:hypothetical protein